MKHVNKNLFLLILSFSLNTFAQSEESKEGANCPDISGTYFCVLVDISNPDSTTLIARTYKTFRHENIGITIEERDLNGEPIRDHVITSISPMGAKQVKCESGKYEISLPYQVNLMQKIYITKRHYTGSVFIQYATEEQEELCSVVNN